MWWPFKRKENPEFASLLHVSEEEVGRRINSRITSVLEITLIDGVTKYTKEVTTRGLSGPCHILGTEYLEACMDLHTWKVEDLHEYTLEWGITLEGVLSIPARQIKSVETISGPTRWQVQAGDPDYYCPKNVKGEVDETAKT